MKTKMNHKKENLEICNIQRGVDRQINRVPVQATRAQTLRDNKAPKWQIIHQCESLRQTIQEGAKVKASLTAACEALHSAMETVNIEGGNEATTKEFESISAKMLVLISKY